MLRMGSLTFLVLRLILKVFPHHLLHQNPEKLKQDIRMKKVSFTRIIKITGKTPDLKYK